MHFHKILIRNVQFTQTSPPSQGTVYTVHWTESQIVNFALHCSCTKDKKIIINTINRLSSALFFSEHWLIPIRCSEVFPTWCTLQPGVNAEHFDLWPKWGDSLEIEDIVQNEGRAGNNNTELKRAYTSWRRKHLRFDIFKWTSGYFTVEPYVLLCFTILSLKHHHAKMVSSKDLKLYKDVLYP